jgi:hypothetical protein
MLHRITALKAPWPTGARVGDIIDLSAVPAWAAGKCQPAPDAEAATVALTEPEPVRDLATELAGTQAALQATVAELDAERQATAELRAKLADAEAALATKSGGKGR